MQHKVLLGMVLVLLMAVSSASILPAIADDPPYNPDKPVSFNGGSVGNLPRALQMVHETTGAQFVILGGEDAYPEVDVNFRTITPRQAISQIATAAHATVTRCCPDTYLFQPMARKRSRRLFVPQPGLKWHKLVPPYFLPRELPGDMGWTSWEAGFNEAQNDSDDDFNSNNFFSGDHIKLPQGVKRVYVLPRGEALLIYSTESGFQSIQSEIKKRDLRRATFKVYILTPPAADLQALGSIPKVISDDKMSHIIGALPTEYLSYRDGDDDPYVVPIGQMTEMMTLEGSNELPSDMKVDVQFTPNINNDNSITVNVQVTLLQSNVGVSKVDGIPPPNKTLSEILETDALQVGDVLALQGLSLPASDNDSAIPRQIIIFIELIAIPEHPHRRTRFVW